VQTLNKSPMDSVMAAVVATKTLSADGIRLKNCENMIRNVFFGLIMKGNEREMPLN
jgi:hypothetical protein